MDLTFFINISIVLIMLLIIIFFFKGKLSKQFAFPFVLKKSLLTPAERSFFGVLQQAVDDQTLIFSKVRIADVLDIRKGLTPSQRQIAVNHVSAKHFDFVLCKASDLSIIAAIELDDASHRRKHRMRRDKLIAGACDAAGLPLHRFKAKRAYQIAEIREQLTNNQLLDQLEQS